MTKPPFGFNPSGSDDDQSDENNQTPQPSNPFGFPFPGMPGMPGIPGMPGGQMPADLNALMPMIQQLQQMLSGSAGSGPVNWDLAKQTAVNAARQHEKSTRTNLADVQQAVQIADLWLTDASAFPTGIRKTDLWTRSQWVSRTLSVWAQLCDPVAGKMVTAMTALLPEEGLTAIPGLAQMPGLDKMMQAMGGMMFGGQVGQALAQLSGEVLSSTDVGLPLGPEGTAVLVAQNVDELADSLEHDVEEVRLYLALREAAHHRLFVHVPWLRKKLLSTVETYAAGISIDKDAIERSLSDISPEDLQTNPEKIQEIMSSGVFEPQQTPAQKQQLAALETLLALIEGWVDRVVTTAAGGRLPGAQLLAEMMRRRRATGGPAEQTFATLVGLELRPRRLRDAAAMWERIETEKGIEGRDALWEHPDLLPTSEDFSSSPVADDQPRLTEADFDALLGYDPDADAPGSNESGTGDSAPEGSGTGDSGKGDSAPDDSTSDSSGPEASDGFGSGPDGSDDSGSDDSGSDGSGAGDTGQDK